MKTYAEDFNDKMMVKQLVKQITNIHATEREIQDAYQIAEMYGIRGEVISEIALLSRNLVNAF